MKTRLGFVSNSSSSSFVVPREYVTSTQLDLILNHIKASKAICHLKKCSCGNPDMDFEWTIFADNDEVRGHVDMDNFSMEDFLELIGVPSEHIKWGD